MSEHWTVDGPRVIEVGGPEEKPNALRVRIVGGRVDVIAEDDRDTITVEVAAVTGRPLEIDWNEGTLEVAHPQLQWESMLEGIFSGATGKAKLSELGALFSRRKGDPGDGAQVSIAVPRGVHVNLATVSADGMVSATHAPARVKTLSGTLVVDGVQGHVDARTVSGAIEVRNQHGSLTGQSVSGELTVHAIELEDLKVKSVSGSVAVDLENAPSRVGVSTVSGDVVVRIPPSTGYEIAVKTVSGQITAGGKHADQQPGKGTSMLREGDGAVTVHGNTVSGDVTVLQADAATDGVRMEKTS